MQENKLTMQRARDLANENCKNVDEDKYSSMHLIHDESFLLNKIDQNKLEEANTGDEREKHR